MSDSTGLGICVTRGVTGVADAIGKILNIWFESRLATADDYNAVEIQRAARISNVVQKIKSHRSLREESSVEIPDCLARHFLSSFPVIVLRPARIIILRLHCKYDRNDTPCVFQLFIYFILLEKEISHKIWYFIAREKYISNYYIDSFRYSFDIIALLRFNQSSLLFFGCIYTWNRCTSSWFYP